jgi:hypothetical protein
MTVMAGVIVEFSAPRDQPDCKVPKPYLRCKMQSAGTPSPHPSPDAKSDLSDFATNSAQVEQARLVMAREEIAALASVNSHRGCKRGALKWYFEDSACAGELPRPAGERVGVRGLRSPLCYSRRGAALGLD